MARQLLTAVRAGYSGSVKNRYGCQDWTGESDIPTSDTLFRTTDAGAQIAAVRQGLR